jgi:hypothetical protein
VTNLYPGRSYFFYVTAYNTANLESSPSESVLYTQAASDTTPPTIPQNLVAQSLTATLVQLRWSASTDASGISRYLIYRDNVQISSATGTEYPDSGLQPSTAYAYQVRAVDVAGNISPASSIATVRTMSGSPSDPYLWAALAFEETGQFALDSSPHENDGMLTEAVVRIRTTEFGTALYFPGTDSRVDLGGLDIPSTASTIACWVKPFSIKTEDRVISKASGVSENDHVWMLAVAPSESGARPRFKLKTTSGNTKTLTSTIDFPLRSWTHIAATYDGAYMRLYVNGAFAGSAPRTGQIIQNAATPTALGDQPQGGFGFDGLIDDMRVYTRALTKTEIQKIVLRAE